MAKLSEKARLLALRLPAGRPLPVQQARSRGGAFVPAKAVGSFVPRLTQKAFEKYGFSAAALLTDWAAIVGPALARDTLPEKLKWPKGVEIYGEVESEAAGRPGATLILRVDPARALDVEYSRAQLLDRINGYFGYRAVADIRLVQAPVARRPHPLAAVPQTVRATTAGVSPLLDRVADEGLRAALSRLGAGVAGRAPRA